MSQNIKEKRVIDRKYEAWVKSLFCLLCFKEQPEPHHVNEKMKGGMGTKTSDRRMIPLCHEHHREYHDTGRETFAKKYGMDYEAIIQRLNKIYERRS